MATKFGRKQEQAVAALLAHRSIEEAARTAGIGVNTLLRWMKEPEFDKAYRKARRAAFGQSTARLQQASNETVLRIFAKFPGGARSTRHSETGTPAQGFQDDN